jgi:hypothetical protein
VRACVRARSGSRGTGYARPVKTCRFVQAPARRAMKYFGFFTHFSREAHTWRARVRRCFSALARERNVVARLGARGSAAHLRRRAGRWPDGVIRQARAEDGFCASREEGAGVERVSGGSGHRRRAFSRNARQLERRDLAAMLRRRGSRETRDAPGDASGASVDDSRSCRSVTLAWRDDLVILARLRPSAPQTVRVVAPRARSRRGDERLRARRVALSFGPAAPRETRREPT